MVRGPPGSTLCPYTTLFRSTYWENHGGLAINGYPLTDERREVLEDGKEYTVQWFERVRMEYHPENQPPHDVLLRSEEHTPELQSRQYLVCLLLLDQNKEVQP